MSGKYAFICTKAFSIEICDDDGFLTGKSFEIEKGSAFHKVDEHLLVAAPPAIRLEDAEGNWLEISPEMVAEYFKCIEVNAEVNGQ